MNAQPGQVDTKATLFVLVAGMGVMVAAWVGLVTPVPKPLHPMPMLMVIPGFLLSYLGYRVAVLVAPMLFFLRNPALFQKSNKVPTRSYVLLVLATALSILWLTRGWTYGLRYQGAEYTRTVVIVNLIWLSLLWLLAVSNSRGVPSFKGNLLFHFAVFVWLSWYTFPYLGELP